MQHHGARTRMLDWTHSAYVAAYFAVAADLECNGAIYVTAFGLTAPERADAQARSHPILRRRDLDQRLLDTSSASRLHQWLPHPMSQRIAAQQGLFMFAEDVLGDHETLLRAACAPLRSAHPDAMLFKKCVIPVELKHEFLMRLRGMNIGAHSLFPGLDGLGRFIAESARIGLRAAP